MLTRMTIVAGCNKSSSGMARLTVTLPETLSSSKYRDSWVSKCYHHRYKYHCERKNNKS